MPMTSSADAAMHAANDLITAPEKPHPATPFNIGNEQVRALQQLTDIFSNATKPLTARTNYNSKISGTCTSSEGGGPDTGDTSTYASTFHSQSSTSQRHHCQPSSGAYAYTTASPTPNMYIRMANAFLHPETGEVMSYNKLITDPETQSTWKRSTANKFGRLAQGVGGRVQGTNTIKFIPVADVPKNRTVTYARFVCDSEHMRLTVGGNLIEYPGDVATSTADLTTAKILWNSTISTPGARFMCMDIKNFYLNTPMDQREYMQSS
jgi:hypothetical protein